ncbi:hypothetical protein BKA70DRAFT_1437561 [Coprinopsis sp. MPI-PUGE-AT-0042]|nr:hypothetical protein BKA70DRAFT_1437561 [Coprinopsis sp. MPI-PUGE-AT-0042]
MTPVDMVVALWSCVTSLCLLLRRNPAQAFSFKYYRDRNGLSAKEDPDGQLEFELTDFTNDVPRRLEMSTLKGVGRLIYRAGRRKSTSTFKTSTDASSDSDSSDGSVAFDGAPVGVHESPCPHQEVHGSYRSPRRYPHTATRHSAPSSLPSQQPRVPLSDNASRSS